MKRAGWWLLGLNIVAVMVAMLLSSQTLAWLRSDYPMLGQPLNRLEMLWPGGPDLEHVLLFGWLAAMWRLLAPRMAWWHIALGLAMLAVLSELAQFAPLGRSPRLTDFRDDLLGIAVGLAIAGLLLCMWRWLKRSASRAL